MPPLGVYMAVSKTISTVISVDCRQAGHEEETRADMWICTVQRGGWALSRWAIVLIRRGLLYGRHSLRFCHRWIPGGVVKYLSWVQV